LWAGEHPAVEAARPAVIARFPIDGEAVWALSYELFVALAADGGIRLYRLTSAAKCGSIGQGKSLDAGSKFSQFSRSEFWEFWYLKTPRPKGGDPSISMPVFGNFTIERRFPFVP
jgi:hypothetical protein